MARRTMESGLSELRCTRTWTEDEGRRVIDAWVASGETVAAFARSEGLVPRKVYWWRERLGAVPPKTSAHEARDAAAPASAFLPVIVRAAPAPASSTGSGASVWTRDGHRIEVAALDAASALWVATLLKSLEERS